MTCSKALRLDGKPAPRTCPACGLGPCTRSIQDLARNPNGTYDLNKVLASISNLPVEEIKAMTSAATDARAQALIEGRDVKQAVLDALEKL